MLHVPRRKGGDDQPGYLDKAMELAAYASDMGWTYQEMFMAVTALAAALAGDEEPAAKGAENIALFIETFNIVSGLFNDEIGTDCEYKQVAIKQAALDGTDWRRA